MKTPTVIAQLVDKIFFKWHIPIYTVESSILALVYFVEKYTSVSLTYGLGLVFLKNLFMEWITFLKKERRSRFQYISREYEH